MRTLLLLAVVAAAVAAAPAGVLSAPRATQGASRPTASSRAPATAASRIASSQPAPAPARVAASQPARPPSSQPAPSPSSPPAPPPVVGPSPSPGSPTGADAPLAPSMPAGAGPGVAPRADVPGPGQGLGKEPEEDVQSFGGEEDEGGEETGGGEAGGTPEDIQTFADATLDARRLRFALNAFGDASFLGRSPSEGEETATFSLGTLALLINGQLGESLLGTAEVAFDANRDNEQSVKLERLSVRWQRPRYFVVGGRTHTDLGYWNTAFHHGAWLHLPIRRPRALRGEVSGGILPVHWIGLEGGVSVPAGPGVVTVGGGVGNGRGHDEADIRLNNDSNRFKAVRVKIEVLGLGLPDLRVGVGGLYDRIAPEPAAVRPALPDERIDEYIGNAYAAYRGDALTLIAEAYGIFHRADGDTFITSDAFVVAGYRFGRLTPYVQLERTAANGGVDPFYTPTPGMPTASSPVDTTEVLVGGRVDTSVWSALKLEYGAMRLDAGGAIDHTVMLNWSFGI